MRSSLSVVVLCCTLVLAGLAFLAVPAPADARGCRNTDGGDAISAKNTSCARAQRVVRTWARGFRRDERVNRRVRGFRCRDRSNSVEGLVVRCTEGRKSIRFYANVPE